MDKYAIANAISAVMQSESIGRRWIKWIRTTAEARPGGATVLPDGSTMQPVLPAADPYNAYSACGTISLETALKSAFDGDSTYGSRFIFEIGATIGVKEIDRLADIESESIFRETTQL